MFTEEEKNILKAFLEQEFVSILDTTDQDPLFSHYRLVLCRIWNKIQTNTAENFDDTLSKQRLLSRMPQTI